MVDTQTRPKEQTDAATGPSRSPGGCAAASPDDPEMWVSTETIYQSLYVQSRGALKRELTRYLRTGRSLRKPGRQQRGRLHRAEHPTPSSSYREESIELGSEMDPGDRRADMGATLGDAMRCGARARTGGQRNRLRRLRPGAGGGIQPMRSARTLRCFACVPA
jgi:hypothetical protein